MLQFSFNNNNDETVWYNTTVVFIVLCSPLYVLSHKSFNHTGEPVWPSIKALGW